MNAAANQDDTECLTDKELQAFKSGRIVEIATEDRMAAHLGTCDDCETRLETVPGQADLIVTLLRAPDPFESLDVESRDFSFDSTKSSDLIDRDSRLRAAHGLESLPEKIGKYFVLDWIARGGFGNVYKAKDADTSRIVAIKVPHVNSEESAQQFLKEARTAAQLEHPSIVQVYDWGRDTDGSCFVVMQYIEGHSLRTVLKSPISQKRTKDLIVEIAKALDYAHSQGIYHRDVKPANILLDKHDRPYLTDFGLAIREDERWDYEGEKAGTYAYMSPEQVRRESQFIDGRTDIWSLGVVFYELLTRRKPFWGKTNRELFKEIENREPRPPRSLDDSVSPKLEQICLKCLSKNVKDRYTTAGDVSRDLRSRLAKDQRFSRSPKHTWRVAALLTVVILFATFAAIVWPRNPQSRFLHKRPEVIAFNSSTPLNFFDPQVDEGKLAVRSFADICAFKYGSLQVDSFTVRVNVAVEPDKSSAGVFWGLHRVTNEDEKDAQRCIAVFVKVWQDKRQCNVTIEDITFARAKDGQYYAKERVNLTRGTISNHVTQEMELRIFVQASEVKQVTIDGMSAPLKLERAKIDWLQEQSTGFGLTGYGGAFTFFDGEFLNSMENQNVR